MVEVSWGVPEERVRNKRDPTLRRGQGKVDAEAGGAVGLAVVMLVAEGGVSEEEEEGADALERGWER